MPASPTVRDQYEGHDENVLQIFPFRRASRSIVCEQGDCKVAHNMDNISCTCSDGRRIAIVVEIGEKKCDWPHA